LRLVSEVIALKLRRASSHEFLYTQLFAGFAYLVAGAIIMELWRVNRRSKIKALPRHDGDAIDTVNTSPESLEPSIVLDDEKKSRRI
jgi:hypothetical protein